MVKAGNFSAYVAIGKNNEIAEEYDVKTEFGSGPRERQTQITTCYIASRLGEKFSVNYRHTTNGVLRLTDVASKVFVDGVFCRGLSFDRGTNRDMVFDVSYAKISQTTAKELMFSQIELTDDDSALGSISTQHIGDITVELWDAVLMEPSQRQTFKSVPDGTDKVHEKLKKGSAHRVKFGETIPVKPCGSRRTTWVALKHRIIFKYRPIDILRAQGIAPQDERKIRLGQPNAVASGSGLPVKPEPVDRKPDISLAVIDLTADDVVPPNSMKRKRDESSLGVVKKEKKPKIRGEVVSLGMIDLT